MKKDGFFIIFWNKWLFIHFVTQLEPILVIVIINFITQYYFFVEKYAIPECRTRLSWGNLIYCEILHTHSHTITLGPPIFYFPSKCYSDFYGVFSQNSALFHTHTHPKYRILLKFAYKDYCRMIWRELFRFWHFWGECCWFPILRFRVWFCNKLFQTLNLWMLKPVFLCTKSIFTPHHPYMCTKKVNFGLVDEN